MSQSRKIASVKSFVYADIDKRDIFIKAMIKKKKSDNQSRVAVI